MLKQLNEEKCSNGPSRNRKLDNARKLRGIFFLIRKDIEFRETMNNARKNWSCPWKQPCPVRSRTTSAGNPAGKESGQSQIKVRMHRGSSRGYEKAFWKDCLKIMNIACQERDSIHEVITILPKQRWAKEWEKLEKWPAWQITKVKEPKRGHQRGTERAKNSSFRYADGHLSSQECGVGMESIKSTKAGLCAEVTR